MTEPSQTKRLDINDPDVWNTWRKLYDELTDQEQIDFLNDSELMYPCQVHHNKDNFDDLFSKVDSPRVLEIGGWKGELAAHCLAKYPIKSWQNIELCLNAIKKSVVKDTRYSTLLPACFRWFDSPRMTDPDILVSAHTIEHFSDNDLALLIRWITGIPLVMFDAPLSQDGESWHNFIGTHKLKAGWSAVNLLMSAQGYRAEKINQHCYLYRL